MYYPDKRNVQRRSPQKRNDIVPGGGKPINTNVISSLFQTTVNNHAIRKGRVNCQSIERTAIITDAHGNRMILREHQTNMNADNNTPNLTFDDNGRRFKKRSNRRK